MESPRASSACTACGSGSGGGGAFGMPGSEFTTFRIGFDASWELDLFGRIRRAIEGLEPYARSRARATRSRVSRAIRAKNGCAIMSAWSW